MERLTIHEQVAEAVKLVDSLFVKELVPVPPELTREELWTEVLRLRGKERKPKRIEAIKLLLEDERLVGLTIGLLADIMVKVYKRRGLACNTSESSIRWYITRKTLDWDIKQREKRQTSVEI